VVDTPRVRVASVANKNSVGVSVPDDVIIGGRAGAETNRCAYRGTQIVNAVVANDVVRIKAADGLVDFYSADIGTDLAPVRAKYNLSNDVSVNRAFEHA